MQAKWELKKYRGHQLEWRNGLQHDGDQPEVLIDARVIPIGRLFDGTYYAKENAYEWGSDLSRLAERLVDYRQRVKEHRRPAANGGGSDDGLA